MPVIDYQNLSRHLHSAGKTLDTLWLIHGEEFLRAQTLDAVLAALLPNPPDRMNYEPVVSGDDQVLVALEKVNTYTFLPGRKVVALLDCRIFDSPKNTPNLVAKARAALAEDDLKSAGRHFIRLLGVLNLSLDDVSGKERRQLMKLGPEADDRWIDPVLNHCRETGMTVPAGTDQPQVLEDAIKHGFPEEHHLIITTDLIDRRRRLYKVIAEHGVVVDCAVPQGSRKAERTVQEAVLKERMAVILKKYNKQMDPAAYRALYEKTGFQLRSFCGNLEKLVDYVGDRNRIQAADVEAVLSRSRQDPVFELTSAFSERDLEKALFYLKSMLAGDLHPLQIIAALSNQVRKLMVAREFIESSHGRTWRAGMGFPDFRRAVMPAIRAYDDELRKMLSDWENALEDKSPGGNGKNAPGGKGKKKKKSTDTRLLLSPGTANPFPVFKTIQNAQRFTLNELIGAIERLYEADWRLKTGDRNPELVLSNLIIRICHQEKAGNK